MSLDAAIAAGRAALLTIMRDTFVTTRGTTGPCHVKNTAGDGTPIEIRTPEDADLNNGDTIVINGRTYMVAESPNTHGMSLTKQFTLTETART